MSRETESMFKALHKYLDENSDENRTEDDVRRLVNDFMEHYNGHIPAPVTEDTAETSDDYLELAYNADTIKEAKKYAKKALKLDPHNYDAEVAIIDLSRGAIAERFAIMLKPSKRQPSTWMKRATSRMTASEHSGGFLKRDHICVFVAVTFRHFFSAV